MKLVESQEKLSDLSWTDCMKYAPNLQEKKSISTLHSKWQHFSTTIMNYETPCLDVVKTAVSMRPHVQKFYASVLQRLQSVSSSSIWTDTRNWISFEVPISTAWLTEWMQTVGSDVIFCCMAQSQDDSVVVGLISKTSLVVVRTDFQTYVHCLLHHQDVFYFHLITARLNYALSPLQVEMKTYLKFTDPERIYMTKLLPDYLVPTTVMSNGWLLRTIISG